MEAYLVDGTLYADLGEANVASIDAKCNITIIVLCDYVGGAGPADSHRADGIVQWHNSKGKPTECNRICDAHLASAGKGRTFSVVAVFANRIGDMPRIVRTS